MDSLQMVLDVERELVLDGPRDLDESDAELAWATGVADYDPEEQCGGDQVSG